MRMSRELTMFFGHLSSHPKSASARSLGFFLIAVLGGGGSSAKLNVVSPFCFGIGGFLQSLGGQRARVDHQFFVRAEIYFDHDSVGDIASFFVSDMGCGS